MTFFRPVTGLVMRLPVASISTKFPVIPEVENMDEHRTPELYAQRTGRNLKSFFDDVAKRPGIESRSPRMF